MYRLILFLILFLLPVCGLAEIEVKDQSDYTRILEQGDPALHDEAVAGLVDSHGRIPWKALSTVLPRIDTLRPKTRILVAERLQHRTLDPRVVLALAKMTADEDIRVRRAAINTLLKGNYTVEVAEALARIPEPPEDLIFRIEHRIEQIEHSLNTPPDPPRPPRPPEDPAWRKPLLVIFSLLSGLLGIMLFLWGSRLVNLYRLVNNLPRARIFSAAMGMAVLRGEAQPYRENLLLHPVSQEPCLYYPGADRDHPDHCFWIVDGGGRMLVNPKSAVFLSEDGILVPGEGLQLLGDVQHALVDGRKRVTIGKRRQDRHHLERLLHFLIQGVLGRVFRDQSSKALFSDPNSCFWIWDDLDTKPLASSDQLSGLFLAFTFFGSWIMLLVLAVLFLL